MKTMKCLGHLDTLLQYSVGDGITSFTKFPALKNLFSFPFLNGRYQVIVKKTPKKMYFISLTLRRATAEPYAGGRGGSPLI